MTVSSDGDAGNGSTKGPRLPLIGLEEHFAFPEWIDRVLTLGREKPGDFDLDTIDWFVNRPHPFSLMGRLALDFTESRLPRMDQAGVQVAVLSLLAPGVQSFDADTGTALAQTANDFLAETILRYPTRFAGLAVFAPQDPRRAVQEIDRAITRLKLHGLVVNSHTNGEYLDEKKYWPIFEAAQGLDVPIYIHPRNPPRELQKYLIGPGMDLRNVAWGFHMETGLHVARLMSSGVFDQFPALKIVLGHLGEGVPFYLFRMETFHERIAKRRAREYFAENFWITTSGMHMQRVDLCQPVLKFCREMVGAERIMFASDYPFANPKSAADSVLTTPLPISDLRQIAYENAAKLLRIELAPEVLQRATEGFEQQRS
jgi:5-carboxyvanillate decarboxylase